MTALIESLVAQRQRPLQQRYLAHPREAWIHDHGRAFQGHGRDPFHGEVEADSNASTPWAFGIHRAVGGDHDAPNPGDLLACALAACLQSTTRMVAEWLEMELAALEVDVSAYADVRGTLRVDSAVPVGFQRLDVRVTGRVVAGHQDARSLQRLVSSAEACCVVMQTLNPGTDVRTDWCLNQPGPQAAG
ncbi:OsmC family protein [Halomonas sp. 18H]|uniref:OsmC family protein n=1 Tax=Halomonas almeriensis TaxID=308163 RepID=UPI002230719D|nr:MULTISPECIES: OsmC family protein [Halomonas]MCW4151201.1 OsmC family protein [Halomonas sp. 18H]MDN3553081.1 OsmC family protein [Halomonas almeriensis]